ncbi:Uncharacterized protein T06_3589 [Trichinella sp. T6]|nr:Uncharacterized protein T06_3589 [Trichinella sp. T6]
MQADQSTQRIYVRFIRLRIIRGTNSVDSNERRDNMQQELTAAREIDGYSKEHQIYIELFGVSLTPTWGVPQSATVGHHRRGGGHADGVGDVPFGTVISSLPDSVAADVDDLLEPLAGAPTNEGQHGAPRPTIPTSAVVISNLRQLFTTHGLPEVIVSDNAAAFTSNEFQNFMISNGIRHVTIAPYHPASNGQAERMVQTMKKALQRNVRGNWNIHLARFLLSQHITLNSKTGLSPAEMLMLRRPRTLLDNLHPDTAKISTAGRTFSRECEGNKNIPPRAAKRQIGLVSYDIRTPEGERHRRHVGQLRTRVDKSEEKIQEKMNEEDRRKEGTERRSQEERRTEEAEGNHRPGTSTPTQWVFPLHFKRSQCLAPLRLDVWGTFQRFMDEVTPDLEFFLFTWATCWSPAEPNKNFQARVPRIQRLCLKHQAVFRQILLAFYSSNHYPVGTVGAIGIIYVQEQENLIAGGLYSKHSKPKNVATDYAAGAVLQQELDRHWIGLVQISLLTPPTFSQ